MTALGIVLAALLFLLLVPLGARVKYDTELQLWLCIGFLKFKLLPAKPKKPKKPKKEKPKKKQPKDDAPKAKKKPPNARTLLDYAKLALELLGCLRRKLLIRDLQVCAVFGGEDAGDAALGYGKAWAAIGAVTPLLEQTFRIKNRKLEAQYDPDCKQLRLTAEAQAELNLLSILIIAFHALRGWLNIRKNNKEEAKEHGKSDQRTDGNLPG